MLAVDLVLAGEEYIGMGLQYALLSTTTAAPGSQPTPPSCVPSEGSECDDVLEDDVTNSNTIIIIGTVTSSILLLIIATVVTLVIVVMRKRKGDCEIPNAVKTDVMTTTNVAYGIVKTDVMTTTTNKAYDTDVMTTTNEAYSIVDSDVKTATNVAYAVQSKDSDGVQNTNDINNSLQNSYAYITVR